MNKKPTKKNDKVLFSLIEEKIEKNHYFFVRHATQRIKQREIVETEVIKILEGKVGYGRTRNKAKDKYEFVTIEEEAEDWKYCIEGNDIDQNKLRIIITFSNDWMPIITVIKI